MSVLGASFNLNIGHLKICYVYISHIIYKHTCKTIPMPIKQTTNELRRYRHQAGIQRLSLTALYIHSESQCVYTVGRV